MIPDYHERAQLMCEDGFQRQYMTGKYYGNDDGFGIHPFMCGEYPGALIGDKGDDALLMCGRCQDFGTYRCEKELDVCDWDIAAPSCAAPPPCPCRGRQRRPQSAAPMVPRWTI